MPAPEKGTFVEPKGMFGETTAAFAARRATLFSEFEKSEADKQKAFEQSAEYQKFVAQNGTLATAMEEVKQTLHSLESQSIEQMVAGLFPKGQTSDKAFDKIIADCAQKLVVETPEAFVSESINGKPIFKANDAGEISIDIEAFKEFSAAVKHLDAQKDVDKLQDKCDKEDQEYATKIRLANAAKLDVFCEYAGFSVGDSMNETLNTLDKYDTLSAELKAEKGKIFGKNKEKIAQLEKDLYYCSPIKDAGYLVRAVERFQDLENEIAKIEGNKFQGQNYKHDENYAPETAKLDPADEKQIAAALKDPIARNALRNRFAMMEKKIKDKRAEITAQISQDLGREFKQGDSRYELYGSAVVGGATNWEKDQLKQAKGIAEQTAKSAPQIGDDDRARLSERYLGDYIFGSPEWAEKYDKHGKFENEFKVLETLVAAKEGKLQYDLKNKPTPGTELDAINQQLAKIQSKVKELDDLGR